VRAEVEALVADRPGPEIARVVHGRRAQEGPALGLALGFEDVAAVGRESDEEARAVREPGVGGRVGVELRVDGGDVALVGAEDGAADGGGFAPAAESLGAAGQVVVFAGQGRGVAADVRVELRVAGQAHMDL